MSEEAAFWTLAGICEGPLKGYHSRSLLRARADVEAVADLLQEELPLLHAHITGHCGLPVELLCMSWLLVSFINVLPSATALR